MNLPEWFHKKRRNSIELLPTDGPGKVELGSSKVGGKPHLPKEFEWYRYEGMNYDGVTARRPLSFLAQINLAEIADLDIDGVLPSRGMLYFFYELETMAWGFDPKDRGCARVLYYEGGPAGLIETEPPGDLKADYLLPEIPISFKNRDEVPDYEEFREQFGEGIDWDTYEEERTLRGCKASEEPEKVTKLLGYANLIQGSMLLECEMADSGIYCGHPQELPPEEWDRLRENSRDWRLLFQMGTVERDGFELMFGDCGCIYFYIRGEDLAQRRFDRIWMVLQCG